jgi:hypothetical protein
MPDTNPSTPELNNPSASTTTPTAELSSGPATEPNVPSIPAPQYTAQPETLATSTWNAANWGASIMATSAAVVAVHSPLNTMIMTSLKHGKFLPNATGFLATARLLYTGTGAGLVGSAGRTAYCTTTKKGAVTEAAEISTAEISALEESVEGSSSRKGKTGYVCAVAAGDVMVMQIPGNLGQLRRVIEEPFVWHSAPNLYKLSKTGIMTAYAGALVNFGSLCVLEDAYARNLPIKNGKVKHFCAGVASGITAGVSAYPFGYYRDYVLSQASIRNGVITTPKCSDVAKTALDFVRTQGLNEAVKQAAKTCKQQIPLRAGRTGLTFGVLAGMGELVGEKPLGETPPKAWCGFFAKSKPAPAAPKVQAEIPDATDDSTPQFPY